MDKLEIRSDTKEEQTTVYEITKAAFSRDNEAKLVDLLRKREDFIPELSLIAETNDHQLVGHILFSQISVVQDDAHKHKSLALAPISVLPSFQKQGIGKKLIEYGLQKAKELGFTSVIVLGHKDYYPKFGFQAAEKWNIKAPFEVSSECFMAIELTPNALEGVSGTVKYPEEFLSV